MEILLMIMIFMIFILVYDMIKKRPVYRYSPADPNYINYIVTTRFIINDSNGKYNDENITIKNIFYVVNNLKSEKIIDYIHDHIYELYYSEINNIELNYNKKFGAKPRIIAKEITISLL